ncbi:MAG: Rne/Rng family ribonuclease [Candidatus Omnitrophica bacterium]|nr:Rne/Rng family ribonuclease [Candidatus Omnitrophota bacterium]
MAREIFINVTPQEKRVAILENKKLEEFYIERPDSVNLVGNIYKGKVESVLQGIDAAFVDLGLEKNGFLYVSDVVTSASSYEKLLEEPDEEYKAQIEKEKALPSITEVLKKGDEVLVQIVKEPIRSKGARLTTHISIPGRFLVMMPFDPNIGISKRIEDKRERARIRKIIDDLKLPKEIGFIVRTAAQGATQKEFFREVRYLMGLWGNIKYKGKKARAPQLVHEEYDLILRTARDIFRSGTSRLEIDSKVEFKRVLRFLNICAPQMKGSLKLYHEKMPLFEKYDIERQIEKVYNRNVQLKSGGYLVFDETESLVAIDVNSGKSVRGRNLEDTAFRTNLEAASEIARQLRLRDIGGIIIIDFIDMEIHGHRKTVFRALERALEEDKAKTKILNISSIGLVEMTRQRVRPSVAGKHYQKCPYCSGRGAVKSAETISIELMRKLGAVLAESSRVRELFVFLHPEVASYICAPDKIRSMIKPLERNFRKNIRIIEEPSLHMEDIKIEQGRS